MSYLRRFIMTTEVCASSVHFNELNRRSIRAGRPVGTEGRVCASCARKVSYVHSKQDGSRERGRCAKVGARGPQDGSLVCLYCSRLN